MKNIKKGYTCGAFDLCHAGHIIVFKEAKDVCDHLVVFLQVDPSIEEPGYRGKKKNKPIMSLEERKLILEGIKYIDEIIPYVDEADLYQKLNEKIKSGELQIRIIGEDWKGKKFTGHDIPHEIFYNSRNHSYSTTELRERIVREHLESKKTKNE